MCRLRSFPCGGSAGNAKSRNKQEESGKSEVRASKEQSANTMHALLRLMARDDLEHSCRMIMLAMGADGRGQCESTA